MDSVKLSEALGFGSDKGVNVKLDQILSSEAVTQKGVEDTLIETKKTHDAVGQVMEETKTTQQEISKLNAAMNIMVGSPTIYPWAIFRSSEKFIVPDGGHYDIIAIGGGGVLSGHSMPGFGGGGGGCGVKGFSYDYLNGGAAGGLAIKQGFALEKGQEVIVTVAAPGGETSVICNGAGLALKAGGGDPSGKRGGSASGGDINLAGGIGGVGIAPGSANAYGGGGGGGVGGAKGGDGFGVSSNPANLTNGGITAFSTSGGHGGCGGGGGGGAASFGAAAGSSGSGSSAALAAFGGHSQGSPGDGGWLSSIPGYLSSGTSGQGFVAIRRVR